MSTVPPIRREVLVDAGPETAFDVFTADIGRWWPVAGHSVHGAGGTVAFTGGQLVEQSASGQQAVWGTVTRWEPPAAVAFTWHPGRTAERPSRVEVTFTAAGPQTLVTLTHSGWEVYADPAAMRAEYDHGWPIVLGHYQEHASLPGEEGDPGEEGGKHTWVALLHRPARPRRRTAPCSTTPGSPSMSRSSTGCARQAIWSRPGRCWTPRARA